MRPRRRDHQRALLRPLPPRERAARTCPRTRLGEHLCCQSSIFWRLQLPGSILADERIGEDDELAGNRDEGGLGRFASGSQPLVEGADVGIKPGCREGGEIEGPSQAWAPA